MVAVGLPEVFDKVAFLRAVDGDLAVLRRLAELFVEESSWRLAAVREALERHESKALEEAAHLIKGSAGYFCARRTYAAAHAVETLARAGNFAQADEACARLEQEVLCLAHALTTQASQAEPGSTRRRAR